jgi:hypothetical protein
MSKNSAVVRAQAIEDYAHCRMSLEHHFMHLFYLNYFSILMLVSSIHDCSRLQINHDYSRSPMCCGMRDRTGMTSTYAIRFTDPTISTSLALSSSMIAYIILEPAPLVEEDTLCTTALLCYYIKQKTTRLCPRASYRLYVDKMMYNHVDGEIATTRHLRHSNDNLTNKSVAVFVFSV